MSELAIDELSESVIGCAMNVHSELGPGLLESIYRDCLRLELVSSGFTVQTEKQVPVFYRGQRIRFDLRIDHPDVYEQKMKARPARRGRSSSWPSCDP